MTAKRSRQREEAIDLLVEWFLGAASAIVELEIRKKLDKRKKRERQGE